MLKWEAKLITDVRLIFFSFHFPGFDSHVFKLWEKYVEKSSLALSRQKKKSPEGMC